MAVEKIKPYRQMDGRDILKVFIKPTKQFSNGGYFYCDSCDEKLVRANTWYLQNQKEPYVVVKTYGNYLSFHQEKAHNILGIYPEYINHINGVEFDNINSNLDVVTNQQNCWCKPSRGYIKDNRYKSFLPKIIVNNQPQYTSCVKTEVEAIQLAYQLELQYEDYRYNFLLDRRNDLDILDLERTGRISEDEAVYFHVCRYAKENAWYYYRYNLADYFKEYHLSVPIYDLDSDGFMIHRITGQRLCPFK